MNQVQIARICHEVNRAYCQALGDNSQPAWEDAPQWQRDSAILGVTLHTENPDAGPQASHESWMAQKVAEGWTYGPEKLPELKQHHCIVPFDELPVAQQAKDFIFRAVVHATHAAYDESLATAIAERDAAERALAVAQVEHDQQQQGALLYIAAIVGRAVAHGTTMTLSKADMEEAMSLVLERGDTPDGGLALRVYKLNVPPADPDPSLILPLAPVLAKVERPIILLDTSRPQGE